MHVAVVTESAVIRGVITAINWLMRPRSNYCSYAFDTIGAATERLGSVEGMRRDTLHALFNAAQKAMDERSRASSTTTAPRA